MARHGRGNAWSWNEPVGRASQVASDWSEWQRRPGLEMRLRIVQSANDPRKMGISLPSYSMNASHKKWRIVIENALETLLMPVPTRLCVYVCFSIVLLLLPFFFILFVVVLTTIIPYEINFFLVCSRTDSAEKLHSVCVWVCVLCLCHLFSSQLFLHSTILRPIGVAQ